MAWLVKWITISSISSAPDNATLQAHDLSNQFKKIGKNTYVLYCKSGTSKWDDSSGGYAEVAKVFISLTAHKDGTFKIGGTNYDYDTVYSLVEVQPNSSGNTTALDNDGDRAGLWVTLSSNYEHEDYLYVTGTATQTNSWAVNAEVGGSKEGPEGKIGGTVGSSYTFNPDEMCVRTYTNSIKSNQWWYKPPTETQGKLWRAKPYVVTKAPKGSSVTVSMTLSELVIDPGALSTQTTAPSLSLSVSYKNHA